MTDKQQQRDQSYPAYFMPKEDSDFLIEFSTYGPDEVVAPLKLGGVAFAERFLNGKRIHPAAAVLGTDGLFHIMTRFILHWSAFERLQINLLHTMLLFNNETFPGWNKRPYDKRKILFREQWNKIFFNQPKALDLMNQIFSESAKAKSLRDHLSHDEMECHYNPDLDDKVSLRFYNYSSKQKSKKYYEKDLRKLSIELSEISGILHCLLEEKYVDGWAVPDECKKIFRKLCSIYIENPIPKPRS